ncbi:DUF5686 and carboxypeptidase regulatory-like domain-containing protein [Sediminitomix flava]|uniref:Carboxypeptidase-like protein n=1 Tax=Sediminitomix flava TaxID=379075 RepID=A0A315Z4P0_SEDFL|nr:DUF5686 and carboxypeptidase regulatory-like domain-containing protein [Sediminitomix flava]PWJ38438.1 carboxypeptidase-like protein [Sediminitomix flava]
MKLKLYFYFTILLLSSTYSFSQEIKGKITDENGEALPFVSIYSKANLKSTISNPEGNYTIRLSKGKHTLVFKYMGMETLEKEVNLGSNELELNIQLKQSAIILGEVEVNGKKEDPAYPIMRKAIGLRTYYQKQILAYEAEGYSKMNFEVHKFPKLMASLIAGEIGDKFKDSLDIFLNKKMVMESFMELNYNQQDGFTYHILSNRTNIPFADSLESGIPIYMVNLYDQKSMEVLSPLAPNAFSYYKFEYLGMFQDQGAMVNKIRVTPRKGGIQLFTGIIYINEDIWNIHSAELSFKYPMGNIKLIQTYAPVEEKIWMPVTFDQSGDAKLMGAEMSFRYVTSVQDYKLELNDKLRKPKLSNSSEKTEFDSLIEQRTITKRQQKLIELEQKDNLNNREMRKLYRLTQKEVKENSPKEDLQVKFMEDLMTYDSMANKRDSSYWDQNRLVPLTNSELESDLFFDSIAIVIEDEQQKKEIEDSIKNATPKSAFQKSWDKTSEVLGKVLLSGGKLYHDESKNRKLMIDGLLFGSSINNVDGYNIGTRLNYTFLSKKNSSRQNLYGKLSYAERRERFMFNLGFKSNYSPLKRGQLKLEIGSTSQDYNNYRGFSPLLNTSLGLFGASTPLRLYQEEYLSGVNRIDLIHGLVFTTKIKYANRTQIPSFSERYSNEIDNIELTEPNFEEHRALTSDLKLEYTPRQFYHITKKGHKRNLYSKYPTFFIGHRKGWSQLSDIDYDLVYAGLNGTSPLNFRNDITYYTKAGKFFNNAKMTFIDFQHFNNNPISISTGYNASQFFFTDLYEQSTSDQFLEAGLGIRSSRLLLKRLPILKERVMLKERVFTHYLYTPTLGNYIEFGYGLSGIFGILDIDVVSQFRDKKVEGTKVIFGLNIF